MTLEVAPMNAGTVTAMKAASGALQSGQMDIDEMAEVMDDARDQVRMRAPGLVGCLPLWPFLF